MAPSSCAFFCESAFKRPTFPIWAKEKRGQLTQAFEFPPGLRLSKLTLGLVFQSQIFFVDSALRSKMFVFLTLFAEKTGLKL